MICRWQTHRPSSDVWSSTLLPASSSGLPWRGSGPSHHYTSRPLWRDRDRQGPTGDDGVARASQAFLQVPYITPTGHGHGSLVWVLQPVHA